MRFSVITITKNNPEGFSKTEKSVKAQTYRDYEWVVIDGDREPDNGIYDAMNKGIERSIGDYLIFMNAGDEFSDRHVLQNLSQYDADFIYGDAYEDGYIKSAKPINRIKGGMITHHQAMVYKRSIIGDLRYDETYTLSADYKFTLEFINNIDSYYYHPYPICIFETGGISQNNTSKARREERDIRKELAIQSPFTPCRQYLACFIKQYFPWAYWKLKT